MLRGPYHKLKSNRTDNLYNWALRDARIEAGFTHERLAARIGRSNFVIAGYERLLRFPSREDARKIARALGKGVDQLFSEKIRKITRDVSEIRRASLDDRLKYKNLDNIPAETENPSANIEGQEMRSKLVHLVRLLSPLQRRCLMLRYGLADGEEHSYEDIAKTLDITYNAAKASTSKALERLRDHYSSRVLKDYLECA